MKDKMMTKDNINIMLDALKVYVGLLNRESFYNHSISDVIEINRSKELIAYFNKLIK